MAAQLAKQASFRDRLLIENSRAAAPTRRLGRSAFLTPGGFVALASI